MDIKTIYGNIGLDNDRQKEIERFNNRLINIYIQLDSQMKDMRASGEYLELIRAVNFNLGLDPYKFTSFDRLIDKGGELEVLRNNLFTLQVTIVTLAEFAAAKKQDKCLAFRDRLVSDIAHSFALCQSDIGYRFNNGAVLKSGARELDEALVQANFDWLTAIPSAHKAYTDAQIFFFMKKYPEAVHKAFYALSEAARTFVPTDDPLSSPQDRAKLAAALKMDANWLALLNEYSNMHVGLEMRKNSRPLNDKNDFGEVEFFIYLTGCFLRLVSRRRITP